MHVAVIGPGKGASPDELRQAYEVGRLVAQRGYAVITGGLDGVMAEASRGCAEAGGTSVGLLPGNDRSSGNEHLSVALPTGLGELRNVLVVRAADAAIVIGGSWGTLSELALARRMGRPTVSIGGWQVCDAAGVPIPIETADSAAHAVDRLARLIEQAGMGNVQRMSEKPDDDRIESRGHLLPEETAAGSDDPERQAEVILEDSDERTARPEETKRRSTQTPD
jgi:uncharacterized protein (TIGR00725 family)